MKKIKWKERGYDYHAQIGCITLDCLAVFNDRGQLLSAPYRWKSCASINSIAFLMREGPRRSTILRSKEDAIRLAKELLVDCHTAIEKEMKLLGCEIDD